MSRRKYILMPDSFKGTLSSSQICRIMKERILYHDPQGEVISIPIADGGEGSVDCFLEAVSGEKIYRRVTGPFPDETVDCYYALIDEGKTAVIEVASCAGLPLVEGRANPCLTTTYGVGQLIMDAAARGVNKIILGLGGSATNDGGCGMAAATGIKFFDNEGREFIPAGGNLEKIKKIDVTGQADVLRNVSVICMCDIENPMYGPNGAAAIFAPQKGADKETVLLLDKGLRCLADVMERDLQLHVAETRGAGAAGAMGAGAVAFLHGKLLNGIDVVLDTVGFEQLLDDAAMVLTGGGRIDSQSLCGKAVIGIAARASHRAVPVVAVVGSIGDGAGQAYDMGVSAIFSINRKAEDFSVSKGKSEENLYHTVDNIMRFYKCFSGKTAF